jgi:hypothetical protein
MNQTNQRTITDIISEKVEKFDKYGQEYLILKLANGGNILVFNSQVNQARWTKLRNGKRYLFTIGESTVGANILIDYQIN